MGRQNPGGVRRAQQRSIRRRAVVCGAWLGCVCCRRKDRPLPEHRPTGCDFERAAGAPLPRNTQHAFPRHAVCVGTCHLAWVAANLTTAVVRLPHPEAGQGIPGLATAHQHLRCHPTRPTHIPWALCSACVPTHTACQRRCPFRSAGAPRTACELLRPHCATNFTTRSRAASLACTWGAQTSHTPERLWHVWASSAAAYAWVTLSSWLRAAAAQASH